jgi:hypothetical protein
MKKVIMPLILLAFFVSNVHAKSSLNIIGTDHDGWAEAEIYLYYERNWEEAGVQKQEWQTVDLKPGYSGSEGYLSKGTKTIEVAPGKYKINIRHTEGYFHDSHEEVFSIADGQTVEKKILF